MIESVFLLETHIVFRDHILAGHGTARDVEQHRKIAGYDEVVNYPYFLLPSASLCVYGG